MRLRNVEGDPGAPGWSAPEVPGFRVLRPLGAGGEGRVWQALQISTGRKVAIKVIAHDCMKDPKSRARFEAGYEILCALEHPNIVRSVARGVLPSGECWHATEYISGLTLDQYVDQMDRRVLRGRAPQPLPISEIVTLFATICEAVEAAHRVGVIHRDLKPSNILVDHEGVPHLLDFGLARATNTSEVTLATMTGAFVGSPKWCSPEQVIGRPGTVDTQSDVYALGVILYYLLTDRFPYDVAGSLSQTFESILHAEPIPPRRSSTAIDRDLQAVILKALAKEKSRRYESAGALRADLKRWHAGRPVAARGDGLFYTSLKFARRHRATSAAVVATLVFGIAYGAVATVLYERMAASAATARAKFHQTQEMAHVLVAETSRGLATVPGAQQVRRALLERAFAELQALLAERTDDPELLEDIADIHRMQADIANSLGLYDEALMHRRESLGILSRLAAAAPDNDELQAEYSIALVGMGDVANSGCARVALHERLLVTRPYYEKALAIDLRLAERNPANLQDQEHLSYSYERMGALLRDLGDPAAADDFHRRREALAERLASAHPESQALRYNLCLSHLQMTIVENHAGHRVLAIEHGREARQLAVELMAINPHAAHYAQQFVTTNNLLSDFDAAAGHYTEAFEEINASEAVAVKLRTAEPGNLVFNQLLGDVYHARAEVLARLGCVDEAVANYRACAVAWQPLCNADPDSGPAIYRAIAPYSRSAALLCEAGRCDEGRADALAWLGFLQQRVLRHPDDALGLIYLAQAWLEIPIPDLHDPDAAIKAASLAIHAPGGDRPASWDVLALALGAVGDHQSASGALARELEVMPASEIAARKDVERRLNNEILYVQAGSR